MQANVDDYLAVRQCNNWNIKAIASEALLIAAETTWKIVLILQIFKLLGQVKNRGLLSSS
jgi:hypothetical protein